jgi:hypothetical protein
VVRQEMSKSSFLTTTSVQEYFKDLLAGAIENQKAFLGEVTEFYLVDLLARFTDTEALYTRGPGGEHVEEPLAFILRRALEGTGEQKVQALRQLGDNSLYVAGFFGDSLASRLVDLGYYISMGGSAYGALANMVRVRRSGGVFAELYEELCRKFTTIVDLFSEMSERVAVSTNKGVVRIYERWIQTGSERLSRLLAEQGVIPALIKPGGVQ